MHLYSIAADIIMGSILGVFIYVALSRTWSALDRWPIALVVIGASIALVLFRRPNGSLARKRGPD